MDDEFNQYMNELRQRIIQFVKRDKRGYMLEGCHGLDHWDGVEEYGVQIAEATDANIKIVRLFSLFHDSCRYDENEDIHHGRRATRLVHRIKDELPISDIELKGLLFACAWHVDGLTNENPTIGACWDADRLDLGREDVGVITKPDLLSTDYAKSLL